MFGHLTQEILFLWDNIFWQHSKWQIYDLVLFSSWIQPLLLSSLSVCFCGSYYLNSKTSLETTFLKESWFYGTMFVVSLNDLSVSLHLYLLLRSFFHDHSCLSASHTTAFSLNLFLLLFKNYYYFHKLQRLDWDFLLWPPPSRN